MEVDVQMYETLKEKAEIVYVALLDQRRELISDGADEETLCLLGSGTITETMNGYWHSGLRWRKGISYLGSLNMKWRSFMNTEQPPDIIYTLSNVGCTALQVVNFYDDSNWHQENVGEYAAYFCHVVMNRLMPYMPRDLAKIRPILYERYRYNPREGF